MGNSSAGIRECSYLGLPVVNIGSRQNGRERGDNVIDVKNNEFEISSALSNLIKGNKVYEPTYIYGSGNAGEQICKIIEEIDFPKEKFSVWYEKK